jgi:hypothetical protein
MIVTYGEVGAPKIGLSVSNNPRYDSNEVAELRDTQVGIVSIALIDVSFSDQGEVFNVRAIVGINAFGHPMTLSGELLILPCPPFCDKSGQEGIILIDFTTALAMF